MDFNPKQCLAIAKGILKLTKPEGEINQAMHKAQKQSKFEDVSMNFFGNDTQGLPTRHNRPLYIPTCIRMLNIRM